MLLTRDLIQDVEDKYKDMLKMVNIPDFTKCIAQFSGIGMEFLKDEVIKKYLITWAKNKYRFYEFLGNKLRVDTPFVYVKEQDNYIDEFSVIEKEYPTYGIWLEMFERQNSNIINDNRLEWSAENKMHKFFPDFKYQGAKITGFFKEQLHAPDELVTKIAAVSENQTVVAKHTISIDPVDMMLASENPYNWNSCYRLELGNDASHADGCMAAVLDTSSVITYVWNSEGKFELYGSYNFKSIRYKRMRQWLSISPNWMVHFNSIYPGKDNYDNELKKQFREVVEKKIAAYLEKPNKWIGSYDYYCEREYMYGYGEFGNKVYRLKTEEDENKDDQQEEDRPRYYYNTDRNHCWRVYDIGIECPCGCGSILPGSDMDDEEVNYNGDGFCCDNMETRYWCEAADEYCSCEEGSEECRCNDCWAWRRNHPTCSEDGEECEDPNWNMVDDDGNMRQSWDDYSGTEDGHCWSCPRYAECRKAIEKEEEENNDD